MKTKFNIGDRVKVSKEYKNSFNSCGIGTVYSIEQSGSRCKYLVQFDGKDYMRYMYSYQLEPVDESKHEDPTTSKPQNNNQQNNMNRKYNIGDVVVLTDKAIEKSAEIERELLESMSMVVTDYITSTNKTPRYVLDHEFIADETEITLVPEPKFAIGQSVWIKPDVIDQLKDSDEFFEDMSSDFTVAEWEYYRKQYVYRLEGISDVLFCEDELSDVQVKVQEEQKNDNDTLKQRWEDVCNDYLRKYCELHKIEYNPNNWFRHKVGTAIKIGDTFVMMNNIRDDVDNNRPMTDLERFYEGILNLCR